MSFIVRTENVLEGLARVGSLGKRTSFAELVGQVGEGVTALSWSPQTSFLLKALEEGVGDHRTVIGLLKQRSTQAGTDFERGFPRGAGHSGEGLVERAMLGTMQMAEFRPLGDLVLPAGVGLPIDARVSQILGAELTFEGGSVGRLLFDTGFPGDYAPFPIGITIGLHESLELGDDDVANLTVPGRWRGVLDLFNDLKLARGIRRHGTHRLLWNSEGGTQTVIDIDSKMKLLGARRTSRVGDLESVIATKTWYGAHGGRRYQSGVTIQASESVPHPRIRRWLVTDDGNVDREGLDPVASQFFYLPGEVWEATGFKHHYVEFPVTDLEEQIARARPYVDDRRGALRKSLARIWHRCVPWRRGPNLGNVYLNKTSEAGMKLVLRMERQEAPEGWTGPVVPVDRLDIMPVTPDNIARIEAYISGMTSKPAGPIQ